MVNIFADCLHAVFGSLELTRRPCWFRVSEVILISSLTHNPDPEVLLHAVNISKLCASTTDRLSRECQGRSPLDKELESDCCNCPMTPEFSCMTQGSGNSFHSFKCKFMDSVGTFKMELRDGAPKCFLIPPPLILSKAPSVFLVSLNSF